MVLTHYKNLDNSQRKNLSVLFFGTDEFFNLFMEGGQLDGSWLCFSKAEHVRLDAVGDNTMEVFHGTCLSQVSSIVKDGFDVGRYHKGSSTSPAGLWGCGTRAGAVEHCPVQRGWAQESGEALGGWDTPVVLRSFHLKKLVRKHKSLSDGSDVYCRKGAVGEALRLADAIGFEVQIPVWLYKRFWKLPEKIHRVAENRRDELLVCRARRGTPSDLMRAGHGQSMTCARTIEWGNRHVHGWEMATKSKIWTCPFCRCGPACHWMEADSPDRQCA